MLKETPLHAVHRAAGARMVDFGGWDMPVHYGSQIDEHHAVRRDAGMFDVSHMRVVDLEGAGARDFLRYAIANNVDKLKDSGKALYSCLLTPDGTVIDDLIVYFLREDFFRLVVNAGTADKDIAWLGRLVARARAGPPAHAADRPRDDRRAGAERAREGVAGAARQRSREFGAQALQRRVHAVRLGRGVRRAHRLHRRGRLRDRAAGHACGRPVARARRGRRATGGLGARDTLRLEAGMNLYGQDMDETTSPLESGLAWTVDLASPRDFVGKAALAAQPARRNLTGLLLRRQGRRAARAPERCAPTTATARSRAGRSARRSGKSIALARLPAGDRAGRHASRSSSASASSRRGS